MHFDTQYETEDKSVYADWLENLTGVSRGYWGRYSLAYLRDRFAKELRDIRPEEVSGSI